MRGRRMQLRDRPPMPDMNQMNSQQQPLPSQQAPSEMALPSGTPPAGGGAIPPPAPAGPPPMVPPGGIVTQPPGGAGPVPGAGPPNQNSPFRRLMAGHRAR